MLTDVKIKGLKPKDKLYAVADEKGLSLEVSPKGGRWRRFKYRFDDKQKRLSLGTYSEVTLKQAREKRDDLRAQVASGIDPSEARKAGKQSRAAIDSFETITREWHQRHKAN